MYAHQVIEDLESESKNIMDLIKRLSLQSDFKRDIKNNDEFSSAFARSTCLAFNMKQLSDKVKQAQKFHLGLQTNENCPVDINMKEPLFMAPPTSTIRPPYKLTYFDWPVNFRNLNQERKIYGSDDLAPISNKRAILCEEVCKDVICTFVFNYINELRRWDISPIGIISVIGKSFDCVSNGDIDKLIQSYIEYIPTYEHFDPGFVKFKKNASSKYNSMVIQLSPPMNKDEQDHFVMENTDELKVFASVLVLLSCKNITTETIPAPVKLNNKRKKSGKLPIFSYKTLVIKPTGKKQESTPKHLWNNRIHLSRGHFKTYTSEKPLFGSITGRFWWHDHVRGQNRDGVVMKDYEVKS